MIGVEYSTENNCADCKTDIADSHHNADIVIEGGTVVTMDASRRIIQDGAIAIGNNRILAVGKRRHVAQDYRPRRVINAHHDLITPGFVDAHNHPIHFLTKGAIDDLQFDYRFKNIVVPYEHALSEAETRVNAAATFVEMISNGTTCFSDPGSLHASAVGRAAEETGIRGMIAYEATDRAGGLPYGAGDWRAVIDCAQEVVDAWNGRANGRLRACFSLNNPYRASDELCTAVKEKARARKVRIHGHMTLPRREAIPAGFDSPLHRYRDLGVLGPDLILVHMVYVPPEDIELLARNDVKVIHCPGRSLLGAGGAVAHGSIPEMVAAGLVMGLGSDAAAISRFLDMVRQMYLAAAAHKDARMDASVIGCYKAFEMATIDGAKAMGLDDEIGSLEAGKKADIVILDLTAPEMHPNPHRNPIPNLVYSGSGSCTKTVLIDGRIVMEEKKIKSIDVAELLDEVGKAAPYVLGRVNARVESKWPIV